MLSSKQTEPKKISKVLLKEHSFHSKKILKKKTKQKSGMLVKEVILVWGKKLSIPTGIEKN